MNTTEMSSQAAKIYEAANYIAENWWTDPMIEAKQAAIETYSYLVSYKISKSEYIEMVETWEILAQSADSKRAKFGQRVLEALEALTNI